MSGWPASKAKRVLAALLNIGWTIKRQSGSHKTLQRDGWLDYVFAFHDSDEIGPRMLARIAKHTGLRPEDLSVWPKVNFLMTGMQTPQPAGDDRSAGSLTLNGSQG